MSSVIFQPYRKRMLPLFFFRDRRRAKNCIAERFKKLKELSRHRGIKSGLTFWLFNLSAVQRFNVVTLLTNYKFSFTTPSCCSFAQGALVATSLAASLG